MRVVCVGLATVDLVYRVDRIPAADEKAQALSVEIAAGGPATNAAVTAAALIAASSAASGAAASGGVSSGPAAGDASARGSAGDASMRGPAGGASAGGSAGAGVTLVTAVGAHPLGGLIRADLAARGVTLLDAAPDSPAPPPISAVTVLVATGQRSIVSRNAGDAAVGVPDGFDRVLADADVVLVDGHHPALAVFAARSGRPLVVDAGSWRPVFAEILPRADLVACSAAFRHPTTATGAVARHVAVTNGADPVRWWSGGRAGEIPVPPVAAVDTAGAGDAFHGALAVARDPRINDLTEALAYAVRVAGIRVVHEGPRSWLSDPRLASSDG